MGEQKSYSFILKRLANVLKRPSTARQLQCVRCGHRTHKSSAWIFLRAHLKVQCGVLSVLQACSAQVGRFAHACFVRLCRIDNAMAASNRGQFVIGVLLARSFNTFQAVGKFRIFFLEPRQLVIEKCLVALDCQNRCLCIDKFGIERGSQFGEFEGVSLSDKALSDSFGASDGCDSKLDFIEHGSPSDKTVRVEELALSCGEGFRHVAYAHRHEGAEILEKRLSHG